MEGWVDGRRRDGANLGSLGRAVGQGRAWHRRGERGAATGQGEAERPWEGGDMGWAWMGGTGWDGLRRTGHLGRRVGSPAERGRHGSRACVAAGFRLRGDGMGMGTDRRRLQAQGSLASIPPHAVHGCWMGWGRPRDGRRRRTGGGEGHRWMGRGSLFSFFGLALGDCRGGTYLVYWGLGDWGAGRQALRIPFCQ